MKHTLDVRGKACPIPVIETKKLLGKIQSGEMAGDTVEVSVDNYVAVQNLKKMADQKKLPIASDKLNENHYVVTFMLNSINDENPGKQANQSNQSGHTDSSGTQDESADCIPNSILQKTVVVLSSDQMGEGDSKLGRVLMKGYIYALTELEQLPGTIMLYNSGARLSVEGSDSLADLKLLESQGVEILTCGTCLNHFGLTDKLKVGSVTNMYVIVEKQMEATKILRP